MSKERTLYSRVSKEAEIYSNAVDAALDHLLMAEAHLFEEFEGRDHKGLLTKTKLLRELIIQEVNEKE